MPKGLLKLDLQRRSSGRSKHERLREYLVNEMLSGRLKPGQAISSQRQLVETLGIAQMTIRQAMASLEIALRDLARTGASFTCLIRVGQSIRTPFVSLMQQKLPDKRYLCFLGTLVTFGILMTTAGISAEDRVSQAVDAVKQEPCASDNEFCFPTTGAHVAGNALLLAIDDASLPLKKNLCYYLSKPKVRREPVLAPTRSPSAPDNLATHFYGTVVYDDGKFRMWYSASHSGINPDWSSELKAQLGSNPFPVSESPLCYAESQDGISWTKPNLNQVLFKGSRDNNGLGLPHAVIIGALVIKDPAETDPARVYKMLHNYRSHEPGAQPGEQMSTLRAAWSPDGVRWTSGPRRIIPSFIEHSSLYQFGGLYIVNGQKFGGFGPGERGSDRGRQGFAHVSPDFRHWLDEHIESFALPDPNKPAERSVSGPYDQVHLGVGAASFGNVAVGLYGLWHNADYNKEFAKISCDLGLVVSNDGLRFREPVKGHVFLSQEESPVTPREGKDYKTILCQGNGILNVGDETRIYHGRWRNVEFRYPGDKYDDYYAEVALATLARDRWGSLGLFPNQTQGSVWSAPVTLPRKGRLAVTLNAEGAKRMRVEIATPDFGPIAPFSGDSAGTTEAASGLDCPITWKNNLSELSGKTVRLRVRIEKDPAGEPQLYAINLRSTE